MVLNYILPSSNVRLYISTISIYFFSLLTRSVSLSFMLLFSPPLDHRHSTKINSMCVSAHRRPFCSLHVLTSKYEIKILTEKIVNDNILLFMMSCFQLTNSSFTLVSKANGRKIVESKHTVCSNSTDWIRKAKENEGYMEMFDL